MRNPLPHILLSLLLLAGFACQGGRESLAPFWAKIDSIMPTRPDSALRLLRDKANERFTKADRARYLLLRTEAEDKTYVTPPTDSLIAIAAHYYDFPKIIEAVKAEFPGKYDFAGLPVDYKTNAFYGLKIMKKGTEAIEMPSENCPRPLGIFIDIFAIFKVSDNPKKRLKDFKRFDFWVHVGALAFEYRHKPKVVFELSAESKKYYRMRRLLGFVCNPFYAHSRKVLLKLYKKYDGQNTGYYAVDYLAGMKGDAIPEKEITATSEYEFAGHKFTSFGNYDFILKLLYGSAYMELPPVEQRERHMMLKVRC